MNYIISEEELVNLLGEMLDDKYNDPCDCANNFLRLKRPVKLVAHGEVTDSAIDFFKIHKFKDKCINVYVEVIK